MSAPIALIDPTFVETFARVASRLPSCGLDAFGSFQEYAAAVQAAAGLDQTATSAAGDDNGSSANDSAAPFWSTALTVLMRVWTAENVTGALGRQERLALQPSLVHFAGGCPDAEGCRVRELTHWHRTAAGEVESPTGEGSTTAATAAGDAAAVGPPPSAEIGRATKVRRQQLRFLAVDGEAASPCVQQPGILLACVAIAEGLPSSEPWRLRVLLRHQQSLTHASHTLFSKLTRCAADATAAHPTSAVVALEAGQALTLFHRAQDAADQFFRAGDVSGLRIRETPILGVRTRWQEFQLAQMVLEARSTRPPAPLGPGEGAAELVMPVVVSGEKSGHDIYDRPVPESHVRLRQQQQQEEQQRAAPLAANANAADAAAAAPAAAESSAKNERPDADRTGDETLNALHADDHAIILALCVNIRNTNPDFGLSKHQIRTYIERLVVDTAPHVFVLRSQTLLVRSRVESGLNRVQQRSFLQLNELLDQFADCDRSAEPDAVRTLARAASAHCAAVAYPTFWELKSEFAGSCVDQSMYKTALEHYEAIQEWDAVVRCCAKLERPRRAESVVRSLLATDPENPALWVALGDATRDEAHLWKAWALSEEKSAAPMRSLAKLAFDRDEFEKVVEYFDTAVRINPLFGGDWFTLGFAALKTQRWARAAEAFTRVCQMDPSDSYSWNNLGTVLLKLGKTRPAFNAISQAIRGHRNEWRLWDNYLQIGAELKEVAETTHAFNTILDITGGKRGGFAIDPPTMERFADNALAYLRGEIEISHNNKGAAVASSSHSKAATTGGGGGASGTAASDDPTSVAGYCPPHHSLLGIVVDSAGAAVVDAGEDAGDVQPLCSEFATPDAFLRRRGSTAADGTSAAPAPADVAAASAAARANYRGRLRTLLERLCNAFVNDLALYEACAKVFGFLDGPRGEFVYRVREVRAAQAVPQWERTEAGFERAARALVAMGGAAERIAEREADGPAGEGGRFGPMKDTAVAMGIALTAAAEHILPEDKWLVKIEKMRKRLSAAAA